MTSKPSVLDGFNGGARLRRVNEIFLLAVYDEHEKDPKTYDWKGLRGGLKDHLESRWAFYVAQRKCGVILEAAKEVYRANAKK